MRAVPAIDLREGACVQLVGGEYAAERVRIPDPLTALARWREAGFRALHVVDLDAAMGVGSNTGVVTSLLERAPDLEISVGGGVRDEAAVEALLAAGAAEVVVGTRAIEDEPWLRALASRAAGRITVAVDVRGDEVVTRGWTFGSGRKIDAVVEALGGLPLAALLVTAVHREGRLAGPEVPLIARLTAATRIPVIASGGVTTLDDLRALRDAGAARAVIGMALYTGALDAESVAREFA
ncbi:MAG: HisA/HisF-related TIM barrel protein [Myxococcota bacterium]|nr:HisA/HisF-related TIM barrel protein [Myxococcota bacterium]